MATQQQEANPRRWLVLGIVLAAGFMILLDATIVNVALPAVQSGLKASDAEIQWIGAGYALAYGLVLIPAGRLGDRFGHKRMLLIGLAAFTVTSALCGIATSSEALVGWRLAQGVAAGVLNAPILALIGSVFPPRERGRAYGAYGIMAGVATAVGPLLGGALIIGDLAGLDWRPIFLINIPIGILVLAMAIRQVPESKGRGGGLDPVGIALVATGLLLIIVPLVEGQEKDWPLWTFVSLALSVPVLGLFAWWELRRKSPLVDVRLFRMRPFSAGVAIGTVHFAGFVGLVFALSLYLQFGLGHSALVSGLLLTAFAAGTMVGGGLSDGLSGKLGRGVLHLGSGLLGLGIIATVGAIAMTDGKPVWWLVPGLALAGVGNGLVIAPITSIVLSRVPDADTGAVSGVLNTAQRVGQALGTAVLGTVLFSQLKDALHAGERLDVAYNHAVEFAVLGALVCTVITFVLIYALPRAGARWN